MNDLAVIPAVDRRTFIGGSDIAAVLGISPWLTPVQLWAKKVAALNETPRERPKKVLSRGHRWESVVGEMLVEHLTDKGHRVKIVGTNQRSVDPDVPFFAAEIDFEIMLDEDPEIVNVELKTVHPFKARDWGESDSDNAPLHYVAQAMWGLGVKQRRRAIIAPLFGADEIKTFPIERDDETIAAMRLRAGAFWANHVLTGIPPEPTQLVDLDILFPKESDAPALLADDDLTEKALRLRAIDREIKARQAEFDSIEYLVKRAMRDAEELIVNGKTAISWKQRAYKHLDQERLKAEHPKLHRELMREGSSRVFTLKPFSWSEK